MTNTVWPVNAVSSSPTYDAKNARQAMGAAAGGARSGRTLGARSGVRPGTPTSTVTATSTTWTVAAHAGILDLETSAAAGPYWYAIDANNTGSMTAADGSNPRVDIVWVRLDDPAEADGSSTPAIVVGYTAGTPASSPSAPATPSRCMVLAQINVPKSGGGSPTVTWTAPYAVAAGGIIPVRSQAERDAITFSTAENPVIVFRLDTGRAEVNYGGGWGALQPSTLVESATTNSLTSASNADLIMTFAGMLLSPGVWDITAQAQVYSTAVTTAGVYVNQSSSTNPVSGSYGPGATVGPTARAGLVSRPVRVTVSTTTSFYVAIANGGGGAQVIAAAAGSLPSASIRAVQVA